ncbi:MAG: T9SS type A sorting domain-containing protein [Ignavibacteriaceae bacterium]|nr:T9SS type A sorting domain-containing protein [Ignavibacteriaceae bacterium]
MKKSFSFLLFVVMFTTIVNAQYPVRQDALWARTVPAGTITMDGVLNEPAWAQAEQISLVYGQNAGLPTSGWRPEFQADAVTDPTHATIKFLVQGNQLFLGFDIPDSSIGGTSDWARWDGILMSVKDMKSRDATTKLAGAAEYFLTYWLAGLPNTTPVVGAKPRFVGKYGNFNDTTRTQEQRDAWDAGIVIKGVSNDSGRDTGWVVEMKIDLTVLGYDVTRPQGDVVLLNFSIWDCDYLFEGVPGRISSTRTHWQSPWGNANANNVARIFARPDVTVSTSPLPFLNPEVIVPNGASLPSPNIDGKLYEEVWSKAGSFRIAWGDSVLRTTYPGAGNGSSGQFQPELNGNPRPPILDGSNGTIKYFFKDNFLYLGADVKDQLVQGTEVYDKVDGVGFIIAHRGERNEEDALSFKLIRANYNVLGQMSAYDYLPVLVDSNGAVFAGALKGNTTINNNSDIDSGYSIEMRLDLTKLGYPVNRGDGILFMGVALYDGDSFDDTLNNYGTRTWWFREHGGGPAAAWMYMDPNTPVGIDDNAAGFAPQSFQLYGNYPNPFNPITNIRYYVPSAGDVQISVYNTMGEEVKVIKQVVASSGTYDQMLKVDGLASGVYYYSIRFTDNVEQKATYLSGKMVYLK